MITTHVTPCAKACAAKSARVSTTLVAGTASSAAFYSEPDTTQTSGYRWVAVANGQQTNFANWFSYYRTRYLMARTSMSRVFGVQDQNLRVGWQNLDPNNQDANTVRGPALRFRPGTDPLVKFTG